MEHLHHFCREGVGLAAVEHVGGLGHLLDMSCRLFAWQLS